MNRRPWWDLRPTDDEPDILGEPGPGKVLVPTRLDETGDPDQWTWCTPESADQWDIRQWRTRP